MYYQVVTSKAHYNFETLCRACEKSYKLELLNIPHKIYRFTKWGIDLIHYYRGI